MEKVLNTYGREFSNSIPVCYHVSAECHSESAAAVLEQHQIDLEDPEFQSVLDVSSLLRLSTGADSMRDDREGEALCWTPHAEITIMGGLMFASLACLKSLQ